MITHLVDHTCLVVERAHRIAPFRPFMESLRNFGDMGGYIMKVPSRGCVHAHCLLWVIEEAYEQKSSSVVLGRRSSLDIAQVLYFILT